MDYGCTFFSLSFEAEPKEKTVYAATLSIVGGFFFRETLLNGHVGRRRDQRSRYPLVLSVVSYRDQAHFPSRAVRGLRKLIY